MEPTPDQPTNLRPLHTDRERMVAAAQTLLVTFLWATSWILIKVGLDDLDETGHRLPRHVGSGWGHIGRAGLSAA